MSARNVVWNMIYLGRYCLSHVKVWQLLLFLSQSNWSRAVSTTYEFRGLVALDRWIWASVSLTANWGLLITTFYFINLPG